MHAIGGGVGMHFTRLSHTEAASTTCSHGHSTSPHSTSLEDAQARLSGSISSLEGEEIPVSSAGGRVLSEGVRARLDVPRFARAAMDGFALSAISAEAARPERPVELPIALDVVPGRLPERRLEPGQAARIRTGAPLPEGADSVVMLEHVVELDGRVVVSSPSPRGKNVSRRGEDVAASQVVLRKGRRLRADDLGLLASLGERTVLVHRPPEVVVFSTGNELANPATASLADGQIHDANGPMLVELARTEGANVRFGGVLPDDPARIRDALATADANVSITSGSSSKGAEDVVPRLVGSIGELWVHGVAIRPAHPVAFGSVGKRVHFALPGNPAAAWVAFRLFVRPALRLLTGRSTREAFAADRTVRACLTHRISSAPGRTDVVRVRWGEDGTVEPIGASGAGRLTTITDACGFVIVPADVEALEAGTEVEVELL